MRTEDIHRAAPRRSGRKTHVIVGAGTVVTAAVPMASVGAGIAAADDYAGQTYDEATSALSGAGLKGVIATRVGDALPVDHCVVTYSKKTPRIKGNHFGAVTDTVLLHLNCNATVASARTPGNSAASPEGRATAAANQNQPKHH